MVNDAMPLAVAAILCVVARVQDIDLSSALAVFGEPHVHWLQVLLAVDGAAANVPVHHRDTPTRCWLDPVRELDCGCSAGHPPNTNKTRSNQYTTKRRRVPIAATGRVVVTRRR